MWVAGSDVTTGDLITSAQWNNYMGVGGSFDYIKEYKKDKELYIPVSSYRDASAGITDPPEGLSTYPTANGNTDDQAHFSFRVPSDFTSIVEAKVIGYAASTNGAANIDIICYYAAVGEVATAVTESDLATTYDITDTHIEAIDISGILTGIAAGDIVGLRVETKANTLLNSIGFYMKYL